jgi:hypothetical protein
MDKVQKASDSEYIHHCQNPLECTQTTQWSGFPLKWKRLYYLFPLVITHGMKPESPRNLGTWSFTLRPKGKWSFVLSKSEFVRFHPEAKKYAKLLHFETKGIQEMFYWSVIVWYVIIEWFREHGLSVDKLYVTGLKKVSAFRPSSRFVHVYVTSLLFSLYSSMFTCLSCKVKILTW